MLTLTVPFPPSVNHYYRRTSTGVYLTVAAHRYRRALKNSIAQMDRTAFVSYQTGQLAVRVIKNPPSGQTVEQMQDIDNGNKALLDALTHAKVWHDDRQVKVLLNIEGEPIEHGGCSVLVAHLELVSVGFDIRAN